MIVEPGLTPRSPLNVLGPVFVTVELPNTEYAAAVPRPHGRLGRKSRSGHGDQSDDQHGARYRRQAKDGAEADDGRYT